MATKKKKSTPEQQYNKTLLQIQKMANNSAVEIQKMVNKSNTAQMTFNSAEAQKSRDWQEAMSKKAHQMEVADLKKAGLNPVLSAGGSGAQSYTTSSATTQNDSGASAAANLVSQELGAMSNMESARMSANASLKGSEMMAKANRYAAQQSAAAQKYSADQSYRLGKYKAQIEYRMNQENIAQDKWRVENQNATTWAAFLDKHLRNSGITGKAYNLFKDLFHFNGPKGAIKPSWSLVTELPNGRKSFEYFSNKPNVNAKNLGLNANNFKLNKYGMAKAKAACKKLGYYGTEKNAILYVKGAIFNDPDATKKMIRITPVKTRQHIRR